MPKVKKKAYLLGCEEEDENNGLYYVSKDQ
jgi:hypothetical protein